ncbi:Uncharacterized protein QTN25_009713 [Entamoeba marina]
MVIKHALKKVANKGLLPATIGLAALYLPFTISLFIMSLYSTVTDIPAYSNSIGLFYYVSLLGMILSITSCVLVLINTIVGIIQLTKGDLCKTFNMIIIFVMTVLLIFVLLFMAIVFVMSFINGSTSSISFSESEKSSIEYDEDCCFHLTTSGDDLVFTNCKCKGFKEQQSIFESPCGICPTPKEYQDQAVFRMIILSLILLFNICILFVYVLCPILLTTKHLWMKIKKSKGYQDI